MSAEPTVFIHFSLLADAEPGLLGRVLAPFARRDLILDRVTAERIGDAMRIEIEMAAMPSEMASYVEGNLRQIVGLRRLERDRLLRSRAA